MYWVTSVSPIIYSDPQCTDSSFCAPDIQLPNAGGLIAIHHLLFVLDFRHGEMAKMARKKFAILPLIFAIMAEMANIFLPILP